jgi:hypothetical protein
MSAMGNMILAIEEALYEAMGLGTVDDMVVERIAQEVGAPVNWVWEAHSTLMEDW